MSSFKNDVKTSDLNDKSVKDEIKEEQDHSILGKSETEIIGLPCLNTLFEDNDLNQPIKDKLRNSLKKEDLSKILVKDEFKENKNTKEIGNTQNSSTILDETFNSQSLSENFKYINNTQTDKNSNKTDLEKPVKKEIKTREKFSNSEKTSKNKILKRKRRRRSSLLIKPTKKTQTNSNEKSKTTDNEDTLKKSSDNIIQTNQKSTLNDTQKQIEKIESKFDIDDTSVFATENISLVDIKNATEEKSEYAQSLLDNESSSKIPNKSLYNKEEIYQAIQNHNSNNYSNLSIDIKESEPEVLNNIESSFNNKEEITVVNEPVLEQFKSESDVTSAESISPIQVQEVLSDFIESQEIQNLEKESEELEDHFFFDETVQEYSDIEILTEQNSEERVDDNVEDQYFSLENEEIKDISIRSNTLPLVITDIEQSEQTFFNREKDILSDFEPQVNSYNRLYELSQIQVGTKTLNQVELNDQQSEELEESITETRPRSGPIIGAPTKPVKSEGKEKKSKFYNFFNEIRQTLFNKKSKNKAEQNKVSQELQNETEINEIEIPKIEQVSEEVEISKELLYNEEITKEINTSQIELENREVTSLENTVDINTNIEDSITEKEETIVFDKNAGKKEFSEAESENSRLSTLIPPEPSKHKRRKIKRQKQQQNPISLSNTQEFLNNVNISKQIQDDFIYSSVPENILNAGLILYNNLTKQMQNNGTVRVEYLMTVLGSLAGYSTQAAAREKMINRLKLEEDQVFSIIETADGSRYFFGDAIDRTLQKDAHSIWYMSATAAMKLTGRVDCNINEIVRFSIRNLGKSSFGVPRIPKNLRTDNTPEFYVKHLWTSIQSGLEKFTNEPLDWPVIFGVALQKAMINSKDILDPNISLRIILESAVPTSVMEIIPADPNELISKTEQKEIIEKLREEIEIIRNTLGIQSLPQEQRAILLQELSEKTEQLYQLLY